MQFYEQQLDSYLYLYFSSGNFTPYDFIQSSALTQQNNKSAIQLIYLSENTKLQNLNRLQSQLMSDYDDDDLDIQSKIPQFRDKFQPQPIRPNTQRKVTDVCCLFTFLIFAGVFVGFGAYLINCAYTLTDLTNKGTSAWANITQLVSFMQFGKVQQFVLFTLGMIALSLLLALGLLMLLKARPYETLIFMGVFTFLVMVGLIIMNFVYGYRNAGITLCCALVILLIMAICYYQDLQTASIMTKTVAIFFSQRILVFAITLCWSILLVLVSLFWLSSFYSMVVLFNQGGLSSAAFQALTVLWIFLGYFFTFYFFYSMVFMISGECALWFYKNTSTPSLIGPLKWLSLYNFGSITMAAVLLALIKTAQLLVRIGRSKSRKGEGIGALIIAIVACFIMCLLSRLEVYIRIFNRYAIIMLAVTGMEYMDCAYSAAYLTFNNLHFFNVFTITSYFIEFAGTVACASIPTLVGYIIYRAIQLPDTLTIIGTCIIFYFSMALCLVVFATLIEGMNSMFMFYCIERTSFEFGMRVQEIVEEEDRLVELYKQGFGSDFAKVQRVKPLKAQNETVLILNLQNQQNPQYSGMLPPQNL